jgi:hypothetical protein
MWSTVLVFPSHLQLPEAAREALAHFADTSLARGLDEERRTWRVIEQSWTAGPPFHVILENEAHEQWLFSTSEDGTWRVARVPLVPRLDASPQVESPTQEHSGTTRALHA